MIRVLMQDGRLDEAIAMLDSALNQVRTRDVPCAMRLECEKAMIIAKVDADQAFAILREVIAESAKQGAYLIERRARDMRRRLAHN
jgi:hypothetical protein